MAKGWSQQQLAAASGATQSTINRIEAGETKWSRSILAVGQALDLNFNDPRTPFKDFSRVNQGIADNDAGEQPDLHHNRMPLFGAVEGGTGEMIIEKNPISTIVRPDHLRSVIEAYAVYISGESMFPEYEPGDIAQVNPRLPSIPGATCVFYTDDLADDRALIKRLIKPTREAWHVRQWNPPKGDPEEFWLDRRKWPRCERVVGRIPRG